MAIPPASRQWRARSSNCGPWRSAASWSSRWSSLPAEGDPDTLIRSEGAAAFRQRLQRARHWLSWELERLLAPALAQPDDLAVLQRTERQAAQLLALLPLGPLRHRGGDADPGGRGGGGSRHSWEPFSARAANGNAPPQPPDCRETPLGHRETLLATAIERAERRALRLFLCSPSSRQALAGLACVPLSTSEPWAVCGRSRHGCHQDPVGLPMGNRRETDLLIGAVLSICRRLDPELALLLEQLCRCGQEVQRILAADPGPELIGSSMCSSRWPPNPDGFGNLRDSAVPSWLPCNTSATN